MAICQTESVEVLFKNTISIEGHFPLFELVGQLTV